MTIALVFALLLAQACALHVKLVGDYDELLDQSVLDLQSSTNAFFARYDGSTAPTKPDFEQFIAESTGSTEAMAMRAEVLEDGLSQTPLTKNFTALHEQFEALHTLDLGKPPVRKSGRAALDVAFKAVQVQLVFMKKTQSTDPAK